MLDALHDKIHHRGRTESLRLNSQEILSLPVPNLSNSERTILAPICSSGEKRFFKLPIDTDRSDISMFWLFSRLPCEASLRLFTQAWKEKTRTSHDCKPNLSVCRSCDTSAQCQSSDDCFRMFVVSSSGRAVSKKAASLVTLVMDLSAAPHLTYGYGIAKRVPAFTFLPAAIRVRRGQAHSVFIFARESRSRFVAVSAMSRFYRKCPLGVEPANLSSFQACVLVARVLRDSWPWTTFAQDGITHNFCKGDLTRNWHFR